LKSALYRLPIPVMVQTYLPDAKLGDKRVILLNGEPIVP
jgi:glutathione synthase